MIFGTSSPLFNGCFYNPRGWGGDGSVWVGPPNISPTPTPSVEPTVFDFETGMGNGWKLVRHSQPGNSLHPSYDNLDGTDVYGPYSSNQQAVESFSIPFDSIPFDQFLFATGDLSVSD